MFTKKYWVSWKKDNPNDGALVRAQRQQYRDGKKSDKKSKKGNKRKIDNVLDDYSGDIMNNTMSSEDNNNHTQQKDSVRKEKKKVKQAEKDNAATDGLRVIGLRKTYFKKAF